MTLDQLILLQAIAERGSLKAASEALHKTQPAISQGLKQLEQQLGLVLVDRSGYRLVLSEHGVRVYEQAKKILAQARELRALSAHLASGRESELCIAFEESVDLTPLMTLLKTVQAQYPAVQIHLQKCHLSGAIESVLQGKADLAVSPMNEKLQNQHDLICEWLYQQPLLTVASPALMEKYPHLKSIDQLKNEYQIVVKDGGSLTQGETFGVKAGQNVWYVNDFATKAQLLEQGLGWGRLPKNVVSDALTQGRLVPLSLRGSALHTPIDYYALRSPNRTAGPIAQVIWAGLTEVPVQ